MVVCILSLVYHKISLVIPDISQRYLYDVIPDMSVSRLPYKQKTKPEGQSGNCRSGSIASETVDDFRVAAVASDRLERARAQDTMWLEYAYHKHHPMLQHPRSAYQAYCVDWQEHAGGARISL